MSYLEMEQTISCQQMEIEDLRQQLAASRMEIERLNSAYTPMFYKLAAGQLHNAQLREALAACIDVEQAGGFIFDIAKQTLAIHTDTSALEALKAQIAHEAGEVMRKRCAAVFAVPTDMSSRAFTRDVYAGGAEAIRAIPGVTMEDIQK